MICFFSLSCLFVLVYYGLFIPLRWSVLLPRWLVIMLTRLQVNTACALQGLFIPRRWSVLLPVAMLPGISCPVGLSCAPSCSFSALIPAFVRPALRSALFGACGRSLLHAPASMRSLMGLYLQIWQQDFTPCSLHRPPVAVCAAAPVACYHVNTFTS